MATAAVVGLSSGKVRLRSSFYSYDLPTDKPFSTPDQGSPQYNAPSNRTVIVAKRSSNFGSAGSSSKHKQSIKAIKEHVETSSATTRSIPWLQRFQILEREEVDYEQESSLEALLLLQKSMLEKQWTLPFEHTINWDEPKKDIKEMEVTRSGTSARTRRTNTRKKVPNETGMETTNMKGRKQGSLVGSELLQKRVRGYAKGVMNENLLTHAEVVHLSKKIRAGLSLEEQYSRLKKRLGYEPSDEQLASSLKISCAELHSKRIECSLAREKLTMSNIRLVIFIAQRYDNMGVQMSDLIQGGLIGLLRGIEKFDSSKGFKFSTYVYWWIRQGVTRSLVENSRMLRLPTHLHERLSLIRNAKIRLEVKGVVPTIDRIAENLNMSEKKVRNATEATSKVFSLDRDAFPSLNGLPGETLHSYIADTNVENIPWDGVHECSLKDEVNKLLNVTLSEREREIVRLYYGLDKESCTWEDISKQIGLSRERVRQVGLVAMEKLKHVARRRQLEVMLVKH